MYDLKGLRKETGKTQGQMAVLLGCGQTNISMQEKSNRDLTDEQMRVLRKEFGDEMVNKYIIHENDATTINNDVPQINYMKGVPYYNVDFIGGFDMVLNDQTTIPEYLIDFKKYNEATCWCNVTGHSMEPEITHGDIIALKKIEDFSFLPFGEVYAIITNNGMRTIKRIGPAQDKDYYSLIPTNKSPEYGIQEVRKDIITHVFQVLGCMKRL